MEAKMKQDDPVLAFLLEEQRTHEEMWNRPSERIREVIDHYVAQQVERDIDDAGQEVADAAVAWMQAMQDNGGRIQRSESLRLFDAIARYNDAVFAS